MLFALKHGYFRGFSKTVSLKTITSVQFAVLSVEKKLSILLSREVCSFQSIYFFENNFVAGEVCIYDSRLSIFGNIQPGPLGELLNSSKKDDQGFFDR